GNTRTTWTISTTGPATCRRGSITASTGSTSASACSSPARRTSRRGIANAGSAATPPSASRAASPSIPPPCCARKSVTTSKSYERQPIDGAEELVRDDVNRWTASTAALVLGLALGCDGAEPAPEQRLSEAAETLEDARADQTEARDRVAEARERLREAEEAYDQALEELERARQSVLTAQQRVERQATDVALFRAVQSALLHAEVLRGDAVVAAVHDGVVTLRGTVSSEEGKQRAVAIARDTAGVQGVRDALRVQRPQEVAARTPDEVQAEPAPRG